MCVWCVGSCVEGCVCVVGYGVVGDVCVGWWYVDGVCGGFGWCGE